MINKSEKVNNAELRIRRERFNLIADAYDKYRPGYPNELIETIFSVTQLDENADILEIGSGPGTATTLLASKGCMIHCIEPSEELIGLAKKKLQYSGVVFSNTTFEDWYPNKHVFDMVVSAQAFHWIERTIAYNKTSKVLKDNGWLVLFWNMYPRNEEPVTRKVDEVYKRILPRVSPFNYSEDIIEKRRVDIEISGYFKDVLVRRFFWTKSYSTEEYIGYLSTFGVYSRLTEMTRLEFFRELRRAIDSCGGVIEKQYVSILYVARKA